MVIAIIVENVIDFNYEEYNTINLGEPNILDNNTEFLNFLYY